MNEHYDHFSPRVLTFTRKSSRRRNGQRRSRVLDLQGPRTGKRKVAKGGRRLSLRPRRVPSSPHGHLLVPGRGGEVLGVSGPRAGPNQPLVDGGLLVRMGHFDVVPVVLVEREDFFLLLRGWMKISRALTTSLGIETRDLDFDFKKSTFDLVRSVFSKLLFEAIFFILNNHLGRDQRKLTVRPLLKKSTLCKFWEGLVQRAGLQPGKHTDRQTD